MDDHDHDQDNFLKSCRHEVALQAIKLEIRLLLGRNSALMLQMTSLQRAVVEASHVNRVKHRDVRARLDELRDLITSEHCKDARGVIRPSGSHDRPIRRGDTATLGAVGGGRRGNGVVNSRSREPKGWDREDGFQCEVRKGGSAPEVDGEIVERNGGRINKNNRQQMNFQLAANDENLQMNVTPSSRYSSKRPYTPTANDIQNQKTALNHILKALPRRNRSGLQATITFDSPSSVAESKRSSTSTKADVTRMNGEAVGGVKNKIKKQSRQTAADRLSSISEMTRNNLTETKTKMKNKKKESIDNDVFMSAQTDSSGINIDVLFTGVNEDAAGVKSCLMNDVRSRQSRTAVSDVTESESASGHPRVSLSTQEQQLSLHSQEQQSLRPDQQLAILANEYLTPPPPTILQPFLTPRPRLTIVPQISCSSYLTAPQQQQLFCPNRSVDGIGCKYGVAETAGYCGLFGSCREQLDDEEIRQAILHNTFTATTAAAMTGAAMNAAAAKIAATSKDIIAAMSAAVIDNFSSEIASGPCDPVVIDMIDTPTSESSREEVKPATLIDLNTVTVPAVIAMPRSALPLRSPRLLETTSLMNTQFPKPALGTTTSNPIRPRQVLATSNDEPNHTSVEYVLSSRATPLPAADIISTATMTTTNFGNQSQSPSSQLGPSIVQSDLDGLARAPPMLQTILLSSPICRAALTDCFYAAAEHSRPVDNNIGHQSAAGEVTGPQGLGVLTTVNTQNYCLNPHSRWTEAVAVAANAASGTLIISPQSKESTAAAEDQTASASTSSNSTSTSRRYASAVSSKREQPEIQQRKSVKQQQHSQTGSMSPQAWTSCATSTTTIATRSTLTDASTSTTDLCTSATSTSSIPSFKTDIGHLICNGSNLDGPSRTSPHITAQAAPPLSFAEMAAAAVMSPWPSPAAMWVAPGIGSSYTPVKSIDTQTRLRVPAHVVRESDSKQLMLDKFTSTTSDTSQTVRVVTPLPWSNDVAVKVDHGSETVPGRKGCLKGTLSAMSSDVLNTQTGGTTVKTPEMMIRAIDSAHSSRRVNAGYVRCEDHCILADMLNSPISSASKLAKANIEKNIAKRSRDAVNVNKESTEFDRRGIRRKRSTDSSTTSEDEISSKRATCIVQPWSKPGTRRIVQPWPTPADCCVWAQLLSDYHKALDAQARESQLAQDLQPSKVHRSKKKPKLTWGAVKQKITSHSSDSMSAESTSMTESNSVTSEDDVATDPPVTNITKPWPNADCCVWAKLLSDYRATLVGHAPLPQSSLQSPTDTVEQDVTTLTNTKSIATGEQDLIATPVTSNQDDEQVHNTTLTFVESIKVLDMYSTETDVIREALANRLLAIAHVTLPADSKTSPDIESSQPGALDASGSSSSARPPAPPSIAEIRAQISSLKSIVQVSNPVQDDSANSPQNNPNVENASGISTTEEWVDLASNFY